MLYLSTYNNILSRGHNSIHHFVFAPCQNQPPSWQRSSPANHEIIMMMNDFKKISKIERVVASQNSHPEGKDDSDKTQSHSWTDPWDIKTFTSSFWSEENKWQTKVVVLKGWKRWRTRSDGSVHGPSARAAQVQDDISWSRYDVNWIRIYDTGVI